MPGLNQTGPAGQGPRTGRGMGVCGTGETAADVGFYGNWGAGRGMRYGRGFGRGFRARFNAGQRRGPGRGWGTAVPAPVETYQTEIDDLNARIQKMEQSLEKITQQLEQMSA